MSEPLHLSIALDDTGWHPASWREPAARPTDLLTAGYWIDQIQLAESGLIDFVTIEDALGLPTRGYTEIDSGTTHVSGRLDAVLIASRVGPATTHIGLVPTAVVTHTEPFHISKAIATLDYVTSGRAGLRAQVSTKPFEAAHFGRRTLPEFGPSNWDDPQVRAAAGDLFEEAGDYVEVVRRLWDSWEDDAEIRDAATGRFVDRDKLHYIDFEGRFFSVRGPSIVPRPPQGQPVVVALAHQARPFQFGAAHADVVFVTPKDATDATAIRASIREYQREAGRETDIVHVFGDLVVFLDSERESGAERKARLDELDGSKYSSDAVVFTGPADELADLLTSWQRAGLTGFRLRPGAIPDDLSLITQQLVPILQSRGLFRRAYESDTLRGLLDLPRAVNRYAAPQEAHPSFVVQPAGV